MGTTAVEEALAHIGIKGNKHLEDMVKNIFKVGLGSEMSEVLKKPNDKETIMYVYTYLLGVHDATKGLKGNNAVDLVAFTSFLRNLIAFRPRVTKYTALKLYIFGKAQNFTYLCSTIFK